MGTKKGVQENKIVNETSSRQETVKMKFMDQLFFSKPWKVIFLLSITNVFSFAIIDSFFPRLWDNVFIFKNFAITVSP